MAIFAPIFVGSFLVGQLRDLAMLAMRCLSGILKQRDLHVAGRYDSRMIGFLL